MQKLIRRIQRAYPQIWFACHVEHRTRRSNGGLTDRDAGILEHVDAMSGLRASDLAQHLGIGRPSLSAHLKRLAEQGLIELAVAADARERNISLTPKAEAMLIASSPLDASRIAEVLATLSARDRLRAIAGIELLASAARVYAAGDKNSPQNSRVPA
jgi:DNA-binding MarR family transcriptional regulator